MIRVSKNSLPRKRQGQRTNKATRWPSVISSPTWGRNPSRTSGWSNTMNTRTGFAGIAHHEILGDYRWQARCRGLDLGLCSAVTPFGWRWVVDAYCGDGRRYIVESDELLTAFLELEATLLWKARVSCAAFSSSYRLCYLKGARSENNRRSRLFLR